MLAGCFSIKEAPCFLTPTPTNILETCRLPKFLNCNKAKTIWALHRKRFNYILSTLELHVNCRGPTHCIPPGRPPDLYPQLSTRVRVDGPDAPLRAASGS